ncbi:hypothetical protein SK128_012464 [Halocaridina rubra]|uniref:Ionotropic glutamate receptor L-glutamate and glycine-binding domain-containing protein n=1 Tax=Halocaridina rubra TaxID=373956 RepID=A0AAN8ZY17_HALRR
MFSSLIETLFYLAADVDDTIKLPKGDFEGVMVYKYINITTLDSFLTSSISTTVILLLCSPENLMDIFTSLRSIKHNLRSSKWLLITETQEDFSYDLIRGLPEVLQDGTRVTLVNKNLAGKRSVYAARVSHDGVVRMVHYGTWKGHVDPISKELLMKIVEDYNNEYSDMKGRQLTIAAKDIAPYFVMKSREDGSFQDISGSGVQILRALSKVMNFTYRVQPPADNEYGLILPNGTVTGVIGMVSKGEATMAISFLLINRDRETAVDFAYPYYYTSNAILSKAPPMKNRAFAILSTFSLQVIASS